MSDLDPSVSSAEVADVADALSLHLAPMKKALDKAGEAVIAASVDAARAAVAQQAAEAECARAQRALTLATDASKRACEAHAAAVSAFAPGGAA